MADSSYVLDIIANIDKSVSAIKDLGKSVNKEVAAINKTFSGLGTLAAGALAAIGVGFSLSKVIEEATNAENEISGFNLVLQQTKVFTESGSEAFQDFAEALQRQSGIAGGAILDLSATIQRFAGLSQKDLAVVTQATIDFAKFARLDLETAGNAVAKALQGSEGALAKYGIQVKSGKTETEQLTNVLKSLSIAQGSAEKTSKSFSTQINIIREEFNTLFENLGNAIIQNKALAESLSLIRDVLISFTEQIKSSDSILSSFVTGSIQFAIGTIQTLQHAFRGIVNIGRVVLLTLEGISRFILQIGLSALRIAQPLTEVLGLGGILDKGIESLSNAINFLEEDIVKTGDAIVESLGAPVFGEATSQVQNLNAEINKIVGTLNTNKGDAFGLKGAAAEAVKLREEALVREQEERDKIVKAQIKAEEDFKNGVLSSASSFLGSVQQGADGVASAFANVAAFATNTLFPGFGQIVGGLITFLAQGPDAVRAQIQAFIDNLPVIIDAIVASIPVVIEVLAANAPKIALSLSNQMPFVATQLAIGLVAQSPQIAKGFVDGLINESGRLITAIADGVKNAIAQATGFGKSQGAGGIVGGLLGGGIGATVGKKLKFAEGGVVPSGFANDTFNARLTSGEGIIPVDTMRRLDQYLSAADRQQGGGGGGTTIVKLVVGEQELANVLLSLNQRGFRLNG
jgi:cell division protein ZapA (FtsZ GTPase activity inhibitor)